MAFVAAKCTECGANIEVDDSKDAGICRHCGTAFVTQKVINSHNTYITQHITKHIHGDEKTEFEEYIANGDVFLKLKDWEKAKKAFTEAAHLCPNDYRCWLGLVRVETQGFTHTTSYAYEEPLQKAYAVASADEKVMIDNECGTYVANRKRIRVLSEKMQPILSKHNKIVIPVAALSIASLILGVIFILIGFVPPANLGMGIAGCVLIIVFAVLLYADHKYTKYVNKVLLAPYNKEILAIESAMKAQK